MASYFVPNLGPTVYLHDATLAWVERTGRKLEKKEFSDFETAKRFAERIHSRVEGEKGNPLTEPVPATASASASPAAAGPSPS